MSRRRPCRQSTALASIHDLVMDGSQFIIATHSPILRAYPRSKIELFDDGGLSNVHYEATKHYSVTRYFLNNHLKMVKKLMCDD